MAVAEVSSIIVLLQHQVRKEGIAAAAIKPGHLLLVDSTGKFKVNDVLLLRGQSLVAIENEVNGDGTDIAYAAADQVQAVAPALGDVVYLKLKIGENVAIGARLESGAAGLVIETVTGDSMFIALEAVNATSAELFVKAERI